MVLIKGWSLLLEAAVLALWPKPQQMCCFSFSLANWQPSASSLRTARERISSTSPSPPPPLIKSTMRPIFLTSAGEGRKGRVPSVGRNLAMTSRESARVLASKNETHVLTQADCRPPQSAIPPMCGSQFELLGNRSTCLSRKSHLSQLKKFIRVRRCALYL